MTVVVLASAWLYVSGLQSANARLKADLAVAVQARRVAELNAFALAEELADAEARADVVLSIKETIRETPAGPVPADIRAALERLRDH